ncbi:MAG: sugar isomerase, partial [Bacteroidota bacterium]|nr:sugar isomerase [Bacteroidota bacterium]
MKTSEPHLSGPKFHACCPAHDQTDATENSISRRKFIKVAGGTTLSVVALSGLSWPVLANTSLKEQSGIVRQPLLVKPILVYSAPEYRHQSSWRSWGGIQTDEDAREELSRIKEELGKLKSEADFPVEFLPSAAIKGPNDLGDIADLDAADTFLVYAAGGWMDTFDALHKRKKDMILFCRHKSGPVYLWYEIISPRFLRQHTDKLALSGVDEEDVVIDNQDEILWRLRALCGLKNTRNTTILAIGGAGGWAQPKGVVPGLVEDKFKFGIKSLPYDELGKIIVDAKKDASAVNRSRQRAAAYLEDSSLSLETDRTYVDNCFLLEEVFRKIMDRENCRAITINGCMGTIMPLAETSACMTLSLLNDAGYLAFCESDFVVIPAGILLANISGKPVFLNDPTYPHDGIITLAHCTAPRRMDGKK